MSTTALVPSPASGLTFWFVLRHWLACMRGRFRTALKPCMLYVRAGPWALDAAWDEVADSFAAWCAAHVGERCVIGLSSQCVLYALVGAELSEQEAVAQAIQQWEHYMDVDAAELVSNCLLRSVTVAGQQLVTAAPICLIEALQKVARAHGVQLAWVGPWWARGVQRWLFDLSMADDLPSDGQEAMATLRAQEPGLVVHAQASVAQGQAVRLQRLWIEANEWASSAHADVSVELLPAPELGESCQPHHTHVWDQPQVSDVLQGDATVWGHKS